MGELIITKNSFSWVLELFLPNKKVNFRAFLQESYSEVLKKHEH
jgi:predicted CopG family antitoxin